MLKLLISLLVVGASAVPLNVIHERRSNTDHSAWETFNLDRNAIVPVRIGLAQRNLEKGYDHVMRVSNPQSASYGKHWTAAEVEAEFAPSDESIRLVKAWLKEQGITRSRQTSNKGWISFEAPVHRIEQIFDAEFREYKTNDGLTRIGCDEYSLPQHLTPHIDYITPGVRLSPAFQKTYHKRRMSEDSKAKSSPPINTPSKSHYTPPAGALNLSLDLQTCGANITPPCYRAMYNLPHPDGCDIPSGAIGIFESATDTYAQQDLNDFFTAYAPYVPNGTHPTLYSINGAQAPLPEKDAGSESDLDFSITYSLLGNANISLYQSQPPANYAGHWATEIDPLLDAIDGAYCDEEEKAAGFQCGTYPLSTVLSVSYMTPELFYQSQASQIRTCHEFMKLSLQGHTLVVSSGDYGVASPPIYGEALCVANGCIPQDLNNTGYGAWTGDIFSPGFPSNCPFALTVGATQLLDNQTVYESESVMNAPNEGFAGCGAGVTFSSGGGFSNYFGRPSYQEEHVCSYLEHHVPEYPYYESNFLDVTSEKTTIGSNKGVYNRNGRAIPDVSANGASLLYYNMGALHQTFGTSLATPIWASIITLLNAERAAQAKSPVGFVNPTLYKHPEVFNDITTGGNPGCNTKGFPAVTGWDPSSGLGTPDYTKLSALFKSLP